MRLLAIDPGSTHSAYVVVDTEDGVTYDKLAPIWFGKISNEELLRMRWLKTADRVAIEMIGHYGTGMPAGKDIFDTCVWIGRFWQVHVGADDEYERIVGAPLKPQVDLIKRAEIKTHICGAAKAKDGNVIQALIDRFAPGVRNGGKGLKNAPGFFYGFHSDIWQAYALAVYVCDTKIKKAA